MLFCRTPAQAAENAVILPPPETDTPLSDHPGAETAIIAGGCFWGVQGVYQHLKGVIKVLSGYAGGSPDTANYRSVCNGDTGHAEAVSILYDPSRVSYGQILQIFFSVAHDPTTLNAQGPDHGTQYRSAIFPQNATQQNIAELYIAQLNKTGLFRRPIVTTLEGKGPFYPAEEYHQDYMTHNPNNPYIAHHDIPKVVGLSKLYPALFSDTPVLVKS